MSAPIRPEHPVRTPLRELAEATGANMGGDGDAGVVVTGITLSSQRVAPGDLYAALPGARAHGADYAGDAVGAGARAVLTDPEGARMLARVEVPVLVVPDPRSVVGQLAARIYGDPAGDMTLLGVTGTQGKTTTTRMLEAALTGSGTSAAVVGTIGTRIAGVEVATALTTPEAPDLHALFAVMRERGVTACAMEVSSHALVMGRVDGVRFDVAAFANLGHDHLDFHHSMDEYFAAKASLFTSERAAMGITNVDDEYGRKLLDRAEIPMTTYSPSGADADWRAVDVDVASGGSTFRLVGPDGLDVPVSVPLPGAFNVANALCALGIAGTAGLDVPAIARAMATSPGVPGRMERVDAGQDFLALVDYAHKPEALEALMSTARGLTEGRVILVVGAGGDRDTAKRPVMGAIGARTADLLIVTDDNPRGEDPTAIRRAILAGAHEAAEGRAEGRAEVVEVGDRREAIRYAVAAAAAGDLVVVAGKGHEAGQEVGSGQEKVVHPFDDRLELRAALEARS